YLQYLPSFPTRRSSDLTLTGKLRRFVLGANHAQLLFELLGPDGKPQLDANGKPVVWGVETGSAKQLAGAGITVETFPYGTIFTRSEEHTSELQSRFDLV